MEKTTKKSIAPSIYFLLSILIAGSLLYGGYLFGGSDKDRLSQQIAASTNQLKDLQAKTKQQDNINKGIVLASDSYKDPAGKLGLLNGKILFTMPTGWVRIPSSTCSRHSIDSTTPCYDTAQIAPKDQAKDSKDPYWNANISVFEYKAAQGTARQWYESSYNSGALSSYGNYSSENIDEADINGDSSLTVKEGVSDAGDSSSFYTVVHGSYAVVVSAQLKYGAVYGTYQGAPPYDYRSTYGAVLDQFIKSTDFKDAQ